MTPDTAIEPDLSEIDWEPMRSDPTVRLAALTNENFKRIDSAIGALRADMERVKAKPPRPRRTGSAARTNPDDYRLYVAVLIGIGVFCAAVFAASYSGQYAMAHYTHLPPYLWWTVPLFVEMPLVILSAAALIFRARGQSVVTPWIVMTLLILISSAVNVAHVWEQEGLSTVGSILGATIMGLTPLLLLVAFEEFARLAVKPRSSVHETPNRQTAKITPKRNGSKK